MVTPRTETERAVFEVWKELRPDEAFVFRLDECAGRLFIPTQRRVRSLLANIARIALRVHDQRGREGESHKRPWSGRSEGPRREPKAGAWTDGAGDAGSRPARVQRPQ